MCFLGLIGRLERYLVLYLVTFIKADTRGLEFSLTSLFIVVVIEMFKNDKNYRVLFAAVFFGVLGVSLFPAKFVLVGSMALYFVFLLLFKDKI